MITVEIERTGDQLRVRIPNNPQFIRFAIQAKAKRDGDSWLFGAEHETQMRALVRSILSARTRSATVAPAERDAV